MGKATRGLTRRKFLHTTALTGRGSGNNHGAWIAGGAGGADRTSIFLSCGVADVGNLRKLADRRVE